MAFVNSASGVNFADGTVVASSSFSATTGNCIVIAACTYYTTAVVSTVTDTAGNTYTKETESKVNGGSLEVWVAKNITGHASNVVTVTWSATVPIRQTVLVHQYSGRDTTDPVEMTASGTTSFSTSVSTGLFSPAQAGDDIALFFTSQGGESSNAPGSGYTSRNLIAGTSGSADLVNAASGSQSASYSWVTSTACDLVAVALQPSVSAGSSDPDAGVEKSGGNSNSSQIVLSGTQAGSVLVGAACRTSSTSFGANGNTTFDRTDTDATVGTYAVAFRCTDESGGDITFGGSVTSGVTASMVALEILGWNTPPGSIGFNFPRPRYRTPDRKSDARPPIFTPGISPTHKTVMLPERYIRRRWDPAGLRSATYKPALDTVIVPRNPVPPTLPHRWARPGWNPGSGRSANVAPIGSFPVVQFFTISGPTTVRVSTPFTVSGQFHAVSGRKMYVRAITPFWIPDDNEPGIFSPVTFPNYAQMSPAMSRLLGANTIVVQPDSTLSFVFTAVIFAPRTEQFFVRVSLRDGSFFDSNILTVTALPIGS